jgi:BolA family transcriptional regulator, general stress-responsive regulator
MSDNLRTSPPRVSADLVQATLQQALQPLALQVSDDSHQHAGHAGSHEGSHFSVQIKAACFAGLSHVQRHRLVYDALRDVIPQGIHALAIKAEPA